MLVLTRKEGESIAIGDAITVTVVSAQGGQVKLGVKAARDVGVHREEVWRRLQNTEAA